MRGSLALHDGVLWVGRHEKTAHVSAFDLDGRSLGRDFSFRNEELGTASVSGITMDQDHRIWVADTPSGRLRCFTVFGVEISGFGGASTDTDNAKQLAEPVDVDFFGADDDQQLLVASGGRRRHAVRLFESTGKLVLSLRPLGDPRDHFHGVQGVTASGRLILVAESNAERIQVFRDGDFHFAFRPVVGNFGRRPMATALLRDGRIVVAVSGNGDKEESGILLFDESGRFLSVLAKPGKSEGMVSEPQGLAILEEERDRESRLFVSDCDGDRVQVFNLEGDCYGVFEGLRA